MIKKGVFSFLVFLIGFFYVDEMLDPEPMGAFLNGKLPSTTIGNWDIDDAFPNVEIPSPVRMSTFANTDEFIILSKKGQLFLLNIEDQTLDIILDIEDQTFKLGDCGTVGMALHPNFQPNQDHDQNLIFIFYKSKPDPDQWNDRGYNRLSSFKWNSDIQSFDPSTENILIQQYDRSPWHDGGGMFFGPDGFLYVALGDEGFDEHQTVSTQRINGGFFSGILRIDVDNDSTKSHPIRRQPQPNDNPPEGWWDTYSQGYSIPNDNPWISENGDHLEEFYAIGLRSPFTMHYDQELDSIWIADVGSDVKEEINIVGMGDNCQWPYAEGDQYSEVHKKPIDFIGNERPVYYALERAEGSCIIGGGPYYNSLFPGLNGGYLFADFNVGNVNLLKVIEPDGAPEVFPLISNFRSGPVDVPQKGGITGVFETSNGEVFISVIGENYDDNGKILKLKQNSFVEEPPAKLSELEVFTNMQNLDIASGIIPYEVNSPLYSDGARKRRWIAIPNNGSFASGEQIEFSKDAFWQFPVGTVFIKHFELKNDLQLNTYQPLETRFFVVGENGSRYGITYQWNEEGTEAYLLTSGAEKDIEVRENNIPSYTQKWQFPSRGQCMTCHNKNAGFILGVKTNQLNKEIYYEKEGRTINQLNYLSDLGALDTRVVDPRRHIKSHDIEDNSSSLEWRIRSYLDSNCSSCHNENGVPNIDLDFRLKNSNGLKEYFNFPTASHASDPSRSIIEPGDHANSELWIRDSSSEDNKMPPLGRLLVDQIYVDSLAKWIDNINEDQLFVDHDIIVYPNPSSGWIAMNINKDWQGPFHIYVFTSSGRLVREEETEIYNHYMDISPYPKGVYFISIEGVDQRKTKKIHLQ